MSTKKLLIAADGNHGRKPKLGKKIASTRDSSILGCLAPNGYVQNISSVLLAQRPLQKAKQKYFKSQRALL